MLLWISIRNLIYCQSTGVISNFLACGCGLLMTLCIYASVHHGVYQFKMLTLKPFKDLMEHFCNLITFGLRPSSILMSETHVNFQTIVLVSS